MILCYELLLYIRLKPMMLLAFSAFKAFQSGVSLKQLLSACYRKSHNTFTHSTLLTDVAWTDQSSLTWAQQIHHQPAYISKQPVILPKSFQGDSGLPSICLFGKESLTGDCTLTSLPPHQRRSVKKGECQVGWIR